MDDAARLFYWRSEPSIADASSGPAPESFAKHLAWLGSVLGSKNVKLYVGKNTMSSELTGTVRLDVSEDGKSATMSIAVDPSCRHAGAASQMINLALDEAKDLGVHTVVANIKEHNYASLRVFWAAGFRPGHGEHASGVVRLEWTWS
jgi:RimJ/RimL family protein N-acetyltransferase